MDLNKTSERILTEYAKTTGFLPRSTEDLSRLEVFLLTKLSIIHSAFNTDAFDDKPKVKESEDKSIPEVQRLQLNRMDGKNMERQLMLQKTFFDKYDKAEVGKKSESVRQMAQEFGTSVSTVMRLIAKQKRLLGLLD